MTGKQDINRAVTQTIYEDNQVQNTNDLHRNHVQKTMEPMQVFVVILQFR